MAYSVRKDKPEAWHSHPAPQNKKKKRKEKKALPRNVFFSCRGRCCYLWNLTWSLHTIASVFTNKCKKLSAKLSLAFFVVFARGSESGCLILQSDIHNAVPAGVQRQPSLDLLSSVGVQVFSCCSNAAKSPTVGTTLASSYRHLVRQPRRRRQRR